MQYENSQTVRKVVVIGGSAAGMMAAIAAAKQDPSARVTIISSDAIAYRRPGIPALIAGYIAGPEDVAICSNQTLNRYNIKLICPADALDIDPGQKTITIQTNNKKQNINFTATVLATGGHPLIAKIPGSDKKGVCTFTTFEAAGQIVKIAKTADTAVVIGAGFIALEIAEALMHKKIKIYFNVRSRILRKLLEPNISEFLIAHFQNKGLKMLTDEAISEIGGNESVEYVIHKNTKIPASLVIMGTGVKPNVELAAKCGIELGASGAVKVDNFMQTSLPGIYAAGDCAESPDLDTGKFVYSPLGSIGASAGICAGKNAAGANSRTTGFIRAQADEILGLQIFSIGHSSTTATEVDLKAQVHTLTPPANMENKTTKPFELGVILTDSNDKIIGAQLVTKKHGSQFAWQLYQAVLSKEERTGFIRRFSSPRLKISQAMLNILNSDIIAEKIGQNTTLKLVQQTK
ncbi:MAG: FAD-dependent oxidoreductase [Planctomycetota bacterium]